MVDGTRPVPARSARPLAALGTALLLAVGVSTPTSVALADTAPVSPDPVTVSSDLLPTPQINGVAWTQVIIGDTVYVGGSFTSSRPFRVAAGEQETPRTNLLAYSLSTGELLPWAPFTNGQVYGLTRSPDGTRLYAVGQFNVVDGKSRSRVAAFDVATGTLISTFRPVMNTTVRTVAATNTTVYVGGDFSNVGGVTRNRVAAFNLDGTLTEWAPNVAGGVVRGIAISPDASRIALGGSFTSTNGSNRPGYGMALLAAAGPGTTNLPLPANDTVRDANTSAAIMSVEAAGDQFYMTGYDYGSGGNYEGAVRVSFATGAISWMEDCHGDHYSTYAAGDVLYTSGHAHDCRATPGGWSEQSPRAHRQAVAFTTAVRGTLARNTQSGYASFQGWPAPAVLNWFPEWLIGTYTGLDQATWHVTGSGKYVVYAGEFIGVNGKAQQGLIRFATPDVAPNLDGPRLFGDALKPTATTPSANTVKLTWPASYDRDNERLTYSVLRNGVVVGSTTADSRWATKRPAQTFTDTGLSGGTAYTYSIRVADPFGNSADSTEVTVTATGAVVNQAPTASFTSSVTQLTANVDGTASSDADGTIASYAWNFGDGATATGATATRTYAAAGTYAVTLTVTDNGGKVGTSTSQVTVTAPPPAGTPIATDDFSRSVSSGWGSALTGGAWTTAGSALNYGVGSGVGTLTNPTAGGTTAARLPGASTTSTDLTLTTSLSAVPTGSTLALTVFGRTVGTDDYRTNLVFNTTGSITLSLAHAGTKLTNAVIPGLTYVAGAPLKVRLQVDGIGTTTLRVKVWPAGSPEPAGWTQTTTDSTPGLQASGTTGVSVYIGGSSTNLPRVTTFDDFRLIAVQ